MPSVFTHVPTPDFLASDGFNADSFCRAHFPPAAQALVKVRLNKPRDFREPLALVDGWECVHNSHLSDSLRRKQAIRYVETLSDLLEHQGMETSSERRKRKLKLLCDRAGGYEAVATLAGVNPAALDQVLKGVLLPPKADGTRSARALGDVAARAIEAAYPDLGTGWFDSDDRQAIELDADELAVVMALRAVKAQSPARLSLASFAPSDTETVLGATESAVRNSRQKHLARNKNR